MKRRFIAFGIILLFVILSGLGISEVFKEKKSNSNEDVLGVDNISYKYIPYITSVPTTSISVGEFFRYNVEVSDLDTELKYISLYLTEKPMWIYIEGFEIRGIPTEEGTYKFVLTVSDGTNSSSQVNYILVEGYE